jgi:AcrR family transcriptional regulator
VKEGVESKPKRPYRMRARAEAAEQTRQRVLQAFVELSMERWLDQISLEDVATRAGVSLQTVFRRFGSKDGLLAAVGEEEGPRVEAQRAQAPVGDVAGEISTLFDHYEEMGDLVLRLLAQEERYPPIRAQTDRGRMLHREWVSRTFAPLLAGTAGAERERLQAQLIAITDVYVWKLLRRDLKLERPQAELALREMIAGLQGRIEQSHAQGGTDEQH